MWEIFIGVVIAEEITLTQHSLFAFICFVYIIQWIVVATLEEMATTFDRDLSDGWNCGRHITKTINLTTASSTTFVLHFIVHSLVLSSNPLMHEYYCFWVCNAFRKLDVSCLHLIGFNFYMSPKDRHIWPQTTLIHPFDTFDNACKNTYDSLIP